MVEANHLKFLFIRGRFLGYNTRETLIEGGTYL